VKFVDILIAQNGIA